MLALFDFPDPNAHSPKRNETTTPLQKLFVLNSPFMVRQAEAFAERLIAREPSEPDRIRLAYQIAFGRDPNDDERELGQAFLAGCDDDEQARWSQYAQIVLASNEMLILD